MKLPKPLILNVHSSFQILRNEIKSRTYADHAGRALFFIFKLTLFVPLYLIYTSEFLPKAANHFDLLLMLISSLQYSLFFLCIFTVTPMQMYEIYEKGESRFLFLGFSDTKELFLFYIFRYTSWFFKLFSLSFLPLMTVLAGLYYRHEQASVQGYAFIAVMFSWIFSSMCAAAVLMMAICVFSRIKLLISNKLMNLTFIIIYAVMMGIPFFYINAFKHKKDADLIVELKKFEASAAGYYDSAFANSADPFFSVISLSIRNRGMIKGVLISLAAVSLSLFVSYILFYMFFARYPLYFSERIKRNFVKKSVNLSGFLKPGLFSALMHREYIYFKRMYMSMIWPAFLMFLMLYFVYRQKIQSALSADYKLFLYGVIYLAMFIQCMIYVFPPRETNAARFLAGLPVKTSRYMLYIPAMYSVFLCMIVQGLVLGFVYIYKIYCPQFWQISVYSFLISAVSVFLAFGIRSVFYSLTRTKVMKNEDTMLLDVMSYMMMMLVDGMLGFFIYTDFYAGIWMLLAGSLILIAAFYTIAFRFPLFKT